MPSQNTLNSAQLMDRILTALDDKSPLSVVSVGQTEAFVMAQYTLYSEEEFMRHREAYNANRGKRSGFFHRGIRFPNLAARDETVEAVKRSHIIGYNTVVEPAKSFTERVFAAYGIEPEDIFEANIRRVMMFSQKERFEQLLKNRRVLLVSSLAQEAKAALESRYTKARPCSVEAISIYEYEEIPRVKEELAKIDFDLCFLAAGVNAVILASFIAWQLGKVACDIGWGMQSLITGKIVTDSWVVNHIGIDNLFKM
ncbi:MAG: GT-D fold domain-containing glycosyltransferase [Syntrophomonadaceae bacterium]